MPINWRCGYLFAPQLKNGEKLIHGVGLFFFSVPSIHDLLKIIPHHQK